MSMLKKPVAVVLFLVLILSVAGCTRPGDTEGTTTIPIVSYHALGDTVLVEGYRVAVTSASWVESEELHLKEGARGLALDCSIANESEECRDVSSTLMFVLQDEDLTTRNILLDENMQGGLDGELTSGCCMNGTLTFTVLEDQTQWELTFKPDRFNLDAQIVFVIHAAEVS